MKKYLCAPLVLLLVFTIGCSGDDNQNNGSSNPVADNPTNFLDIGASANDLLSNTNFDALVIEVAYVSGFRPTNETMTNFEDYIRERTFKQNIEIVYRELPSPNEETLTLQEISDLEIENRTIYNDGTTIAVYIYFADAASETDDEDEGLVTLGAVYRNTSMVIYEQTVQILEGLSPTISITDVETATLNHEFGHLLGLVNLGTPLTNAHEDPEAEGHCDIDGCLMQAELEFGGAMMRLLESRTSKGLVAIPVLDAECILDLQNNGGR
ncbi:MAG: hypothetical protein AAGB24_06960 [Bacteroidota bacterium]